jgi:hypothetical protein
MGRADVARAGRIQRGVADAKLKEVYTSNLWDGLFE